MTTETRQKLGPLDCIVIDGGDNPAVVVVMCHGYGASLDDLAPLAGQWLSMLGEAADQFRFVFPNAPHSLADMGMPAARAWWPINMARLADAVQAERFDQLHDEVPPGIDQARQALQDVIQAAMDDLPSDDPKLVLGGFSQGAMVTMDTTLRGTCQSPALLLQFSGTVICRPQWQAAAAQRIKATQVFQSHGKIDPVLPYDSAIVLRDLLRLAGAKLDFHAFHGPHAIDGQSIEKVAVLLAKVLESPPEESEEWPDDTLDGAVDDIAGDASRRGAGENAKSADP